MFIIERFHIKRTRLKSYVNNEIGTRRLVHNKRMFIISEFIINCVKQTMTVDPR